MNIEKAKDILMRHDSVGINPDGIKELLNEGKGTSFAQINYVTNVATKAAFKDTVIQKVVSANVQVFANISNAQNVYQKAVKRSADKIGETNADAFVPAPAHFEHTDCYSIVTNKKTGKPYLYAIYNNSDSVYFINGEVATKEQVAEYLTDSAKEKLLNPSNVTYNVNQNVVHSVVLRTIALENITDIKAHKTIVTLT